MRNGNEEPLRVCYSVSGTALQGREFAALSGYLDFAPGEHEAALAIHPLPNYRNTRENLTVIITLQGCPRGTFELGDATEAEAIIIHDPTRKGLPVDEHFFATLDYSLPSLAPVRRAVAAGRYAEARARLATHFRSARAQIFPLDPPCVDFPQIEAALEHTYTVFGITHSFGPTMDWSATAVSDPNYCWGLNRHHWWPHYAAAYSADPVKNRRYAEALFAELAGWLATSPVTLAYHPLQPGDRWRHLEVGIRLGSYWPAAFSLVKDSPLLSDDLLVDWLKSFYVHARHLEVNAELFTNRGANEATGLYTAGVLFPEFADSGHWATLGLRRMEEMLRHDLMPDGVENEFSPNYHALVITDIVKMRRSALANGRSLTPAIESALVKLFDYLLFASEPSARLPHLNDSCHTAVDHYLKIAADLYPERADYRWLATGGASGSPPGLTSHVFPDAGHAVMRSHWGPDACYLLLDAGPFGTSHGHEDCLSLNVGGYGARHLVDCGPYNYEDTHPFRLYSCGSHGKTIPLIDNLDQNRKSALPTKSGLNPNVDVRVGEPAIAPPHSWTHATPVVWRTSPRYDYAAGTYGTHPEEVWGPDRTRPGVVTRHVFFLKPDTWVVIDAFKPFDATPHAYSGLFQCCTEKAVVDHATQRVTIQLQPGEFDPDRRVVVNALQASLTITPLPVPGLLLSVVKGQETPNISGFLFEKNTTWLKHPIPTVRYELPPTAGPVCLAYVLAAAPAGAAPRTPFIATVPTAPGTFGVSITCPKRGANQVREHTLLIACDGKHVTWAKRAHSVPALIVADAIPQDWAAS